MASSSSQSKETSTFTSHVNDISSSITVLLRLLRPLDISCDPINGLSGDLETFHYSLVLLSHQVLNDDKKYQDWCDVSRLSALLGNAQACFARIKTMLLNGIRNESFSVRRYLLKSAGEMQHLRLRLTIYITALSNPLLLSAVYSIHYSFNADFRALALNAIDDWINELTKNSIKLARDDSIPELSVTISYRPGSSKTGGTDLRQQREELIKILQSLIGVAMKMVKWCRSNASAQSHGENAIEMAEASTREPSFAQTSASTKTTKTQIEDSLQRITLTEVSPLHLSSTMHTPFSTHFPTLCDSPSSDYYDGATHDTNTNATDDLTRLNHLYSNAQSILSLSMYTEALSQLEAAFSLLPRTTSTSPPTSPSTPSDTDILFLIAHACMHTQPPRVTRARQALKDIYTSASPIAPSLRYNAAHTLGQLYTFVDGNVKDETVNWNDLDMNMKKAVEYVVAAVKGRKEMLGLTHDDTQKSIRLLVELCRRVEGCEAVVLKEVLDVLRETFADGDGERGVMLA
ncbi:hypothetical protein CC80DRAFT_597424 [Byssothecium circinans]|uniref:Uncharacterized protein n=1 Tax=Byssothecium circinans TaxID=147558 RepID=A0A6A5TH56_9PLEO|nr:hypothetical protein CC80DRAFT_597424 [Byssothecium circinans]